MSQLLFSPSQCTPSHRIYSNDSWRLLDDPSRSPFDQCLSLWYKCALSAYLCDLGPISLHLWFTRWSYPFYTHNHVYCFSFEGMSLVVFLLAILKPRSTMRLSNMPSPRPSSQRTLYSLCAMWWPTRMSLKSMSSDLFYSPLDCASLTMIYNSRASPSTTTSNSLFPLSYVTLYVVEGTRWIPMRFKSSPTLLSLSNLLYWWIVPSRMEKWSFSSKTQNRIKPSSPPSCTARTRMTRIFPIHSSYDHISLSHG